jgi:sugar lactone lactonase YvrE
MAVTEIGGADLDLALDARAQLAEGPLWDEHERVLWWVDIMRGHVHRFDPATGDDRVLDVGQPVGAVALREDPGSLVLAVRDGFATLDVASGAVAPLADVEKDEAGNRMNDGYCDARGRFWAGTMPMDDSGPRGALYRLDADHRVTRMLTGISCSNGIDWTDDGRTMYYIDTPTARVDVLDVDPESGDIADRRPLIRIADGEGLPDGMVLDDEDHPWVALWGGHQLRRYTPDGDLDVVVHMPAARVTKPAFGGPGLDELYITTAWNGLSDAERADQPLAGSVFRCRPGVRGRAPARYRG